VAGKNSDAVNNPETSQAGSQSIDLDELRRQFDTEARTRTLGGWQAMMVLVAAVSLSLSLLHIRFWSSSGYQAEIGPPCLRPVSCLYALSGRGKGKKGQGCMVRLCSCFSGGLCGVVSRFLL
jgi:hypothetical protein